MKYQIHKQLLKELYRDIKLYISIYYNYEDKNLFYLFEKIKHLFIIYIHKLKTEKILYKQKNGKRKKSFK